MKHDRHEARGAVHDAMATSIGQMVCLTASLVFSVLVPRFLGAALYGEWMLFRGLAFFWLMLFTLGDREVVSSFYLPRRVGGDREGAARILKSLAAIRVTLILPATLGMLAMLFSSSCLFRAWETAACLVGTMVLKGLQSSLSNIIYGHRRFGWIALIETMQAVLVPAAVLIAFRGKDPMTIPFAVLVADATVFVVTVAVSRVRDEWTAGWLPRRDLIEMIRYAFVVSLATSIILSFNNLLLYLMNMRRFPAATLGWVGLSIRCAWVAHASLTTVASALMPILATVQMRHGAGRMRAWQNFLSRLGLALLLILTGNVLMLGPWGVQRVWGGEYSAMTPLLATSLLAVAGIWVGSQWIRQFLLNRQTRVYLGSAVVYALTVVAVFYLMPRDEAGWAPVVALLVAGGVMAGYAGSHALRQGASCRWLLRFIPVLGWLACAALIRPGEMMTMTLVIEALIWNVGSIALFLLTGAVRWAEVTDITRLLVTPRVRH